MRTRFKNWTVFAAAVAGLSIVFCMTLPAAPGTEKGINANAWLSQFIGEKVSVTFNTPPPYEQRNAAVQLILVETSGVVLDVGGKQTFIPYANIVSMQPSTRRP